MCVNSYSILYVYIYIYIYDRNMWKVGLIKHFSDLDV